MIAWNSRWPVSMGCARRPRRDVFSLPRPREMKRTAAKPSCDQNRRFESVGGAPPARRSLEANLHRFSETERAGLPAGGGRALVIVPVVTPPSPPLVIVRQTCQAGCNGSFNSSRRPPPPPDAHSIRLRRFDMRHSAHRPRFSIAPPLRSRRPADGFSYVRSPFPRVYCSDVGSPLRAVRHRRYGASASSVWRIIKPLCDGGSPPVPSTNTAASVASPATSARRSETQSTRPHSRSPPPLMVVELRRRHRTRGPRDARRPDRTSACSLNSCKRIPRPARERESQATPHTVLRALVSSSFSAEEWID